MSILSNRMKRVLDAYGLSILTASDICEDISPSALKSWIADNRIPSIDGILSFASTFVVSIDWLVGINDSIYNDSIVRYSEQKFGLMTPDTGGYNVFYEHFVRDNYYNGIDFVGDKRIEQNALAYEDADKRAQAFSLEARANALVCQRLLLLIYEQKRKIEKENPIALGKLNAMERSIVNGLKIIALTGQPAFVVENI